MINAIVTFIIIAAVVYFLIVAPMAKLVLRLHGDLINAVAAKRCKYCTVELVSLTAGSN